MPKPKMARYTVGDFERDFPDEDACLRWLLAHLYPDGIACNGAECGGKVRKHHRVKSRRSFSCDFCGHHVHPTAGTIFHKSPTPLRTWFHAIYLMSSTRTGVSAKWLERQTGVTYKTAWRMFKQIRSMLDDGRPTMQGSVEVDETYFGGKKKGQIGPRGPNKTLLIGFAERGGRIYATVIPDQKKRTLIPMVEKHVLSGSNVFTDELMSYHGLTKAGYEHKPVNHRKGVWVIGDVHTNTVEGFWALLKRGIDGAHRRISAKYLQRYVDEYAFRFNHRLDQQPMFWSMLRQVSA